jgi:hypothetical protein
MIVMMMTKAAEEKKSEVELTEDAIRGELITVGRESAEWCEGVRVKLGWWWWLEINTSTSTGE